MQPLSSSNDYFSVLGVPPVYELDQNLLEERFQQIVGELHPDFFINSSKEDQRLSERASTILNQAFEVLKDPFKRAKYLITMRGKELEWNERVLPQGFLEEMFALQEQLDEMQENQDHEGVKQMWDMMENQRENLKFELVRSFKLLENVENSWEVIEEIQKNLNAEHYLQRLFERIPDEETS